MIRKACLKLNNPLIWLLCAGDGLAAPWYCPGIAALIAAITTGFSPLTSASTAIGRGGHFSPFAAIKHRVLASVL
jgi:hypothetical protein